LAVSWVKADIITQGDTTPAINVAGNFTVTGALMVGNSALGTVAVNNGSILGISNDNTDPMNPVPGDLLLGVGLMSQGNATLANANSQINVDRNTVVGLSNVGIFTQSGGTHTVGQDLILADGFQAQGTYDLTGGKLSVASTTDVGRGNVGTFNQSGSSTHETGALVVGTQTGATGTYNLTSGTLTIRGLGQTTVGQSGTGTFNQSGGTHTADHLVVGDNPFSDGTYNLTDGTVTTRETTVGNSGGGTFNQRGGTHKTTMDLTLGSAAKAEGEYNLFGGDLLVGDQTTVGDSGSGQFFLLGGNHKVTGNLVLANNAGSAGSYNFFSGGLDVVGAMIVGQGGTGEYSQLDGTATLGGLEVGVAGSGKATVAGHAQLNVNGDGAVGTATGMGALQVGGALGGGNVTVTGNLQLGGVRLDAAGAGEATVSGAGSVLKATTIEIGGVNLPLMFMVANPGVLHVGNGGQVDAVVNVNPTGSLDGQTGVKDFKKNVNNIGGKVVAAPGSFNIEGAYAQNGGGSLEIDLASLTSFGMLDIAGSAAFAAGETLDFEFTGFTPTEGDMFTFLIALGGVNVLPSDFNCTNGVFACVFSGVPSGLEFEVESAHDTLTLITLNSVPEPTTLGLLGVSLMILASLCSVRAPREIKRRDG
jgi:hypothetical protein